MSLAWCDVEALLIAELPEFADVVREHQDSREFSTDYVLIGQLYDFVATALKKEPNDVGRDIARRAFALVERALVEGDDLVQNCFSIEMIEPLMITRNPALESIMEPAARKDLDVKREWWRRHETMSGAILAANVELGCNVLKGVGIGTETVRVIADSSLWATLPPVDRDDTFHSLRKHWMDLRGRHDSKEMSGLEITGTREEEFVILAADSLADPS